MFKFSKYVTAILIKTPNIKINIKLLKLLNEIEYYTLKSPKSLAYEYVWATIDTKQEQLMIYYREKNVDAAGLVKVLC